MVRESASPEQDLKREVPESTRKRNRMDIDDDPDTQKAVADDGVDGDAEDHDGASDDRQQGRGGKSERGGRREREAGSARDGEGKRVEGGDEGKRADDDGERKVDRKREDTRRERRDDGRRDEKRANHGSRDVSNVESSLRFLVPNALAGSIIGKGGAVISEFQSQSGAKIVLSRTKEFYPHTLDRIIMLNGTVNAILTALHLVVSKLAEEERSKGSPKREGDRVLDLKIIVPNRVCGALIGRGGNTIRSFGEDSGAQLKLSSQETSQGAVGERMITIMGTVEQQLKAVALILAKASEDPSYLSYADVPLSYTASGGAAMFAPPRAAALYTPSSAYPMPGMRSRSPPLTGSQSMGSTTIIVAVPDEHVGAVVGKGGRTLQEITQHSGARIQVSDRGDFVEGTSNRKLTITGSADCVVSAQHLIAQKVQASIQMLDDDPRRPRGAGPADFGSSYRSSGMRDDRRDDFRGDYRDGRRDYDRGRDREDRDRDRGRGRDYDFERRDRDRRSGRDPDW